MVSVGNCPAHFIPKSSGPQTREDKVGRTAADSYGFLCFSPQLCSLCALVSFSGVLWSVGAAWLIHEAPVTYGAPASGCEPSLCQVALLRPEISLALAMATKIWGRLHSLACWFRAPEVVWALGCYHLYRHGGPRLVPQGAIGGSSWWVGDRQTTQREHLGIEFIWWIIEGEGEKGRRGEER